MLLALYWAAGNVLGLYVSLLWLPGYEALYICQLCGGEGPGPLNPVLPHGVTDGRWFSVEMLDCFWGIDGLGMSSEKALN